MKNMYKAISKHLKKIAKLRLFLLLISIMLTVLGLLYIRYTWVTRIDETSKEAINIAETAEIFFSKAALNKLEVSWSDIDRPEYKLVKSNLEKLVKVNKKTRFAYIYTQKSHKIYLMADSEPVESEDYSLPGEEYSCTHEG